MHTAVKTDFLIIGAGIMGLTVARALKAKDSSASITIIEKENGAAAHASGRNSGVLHAGFYYGADSLKAKFCRDGNAAMKAYVRAHKLRMIECGKVVVAKNEAEQEMLMELKRRGDTNGVELRIIDEKEMAEIEPYAKTHKQAIYSPTTATVDPLEVCECMAKELSENGVRILYRHAYKRRLDDHTVIAGDKVFEARRVVNCAGVYADKIARDFGFCGDYTIIPFKGIYLTHTGARPPVKTCIYCVPNLQNPFLGVHFGIRMDGTVRLGPTAIPAFWREHYHGFENFSFEEMTAITAREAQLFLTNAYGFRDMAFTEMKKYSRAYMLSEAGKMVRNVDMSVFNIWSRPGIRAQLLDIRTRKLVQDFIVEGDAHSTHVLNAVSPAFTSSIPFAEWVVNGMHL